MKQILLALLAAIPIVVLAQVTTSPQKAITPNYDSHAIRIEGSTNQNVPYITIVNEKGTAFSVGSSCNVTLGATTNQMIFGGTNTAPGTTATPFAWVSVQVKGDANVYRIPLYK